MYGSRFVSSYLAGQAAKDTAEDVGTDAAKGGGFGLFKFLSSLFREAPASPSAPVSYGTGLPGFSSPEEYHAAIARTIIGEAEDVAEDA